MDAAAELYDEVHVPPHDQARLMRDVFTKDWARNPPPYLKLTSENEIQAKVADVLEPRNTEIENIKTLKVALDLARDKDNQVDIVCNAERQFGLTDALKVLASDAQAIKTVTFGDVMKEAHAQGKLRLTGDIDQDRKCVMQLQKDGQAQIAAEFQRGQDPFHSADFSQKDGLRNIAENSPEHRQHLEQLPGERLKSAERWLKATSEQAPTQEAQVNHQLDQDHEIGD